ncbi:Uncharacterised protein [uncultured archaeon]|nr:Uncharacterised protein [uncultured archaeon]
MASVTTPHHIVAGMDEKASGWALFSAWYIRLEVTTSRIIMMKNIMPSSSFFSFSTSKKVCSDSE